MTHLRSIRSASVVFAFAAVVVVALGAPAFAADVTTPFAGKAVNGGTVTHETSGDRHVLTVSADFVVPGSPDPHWQVVDSKGQIYMLERRPTMHGVGDDDGKTLYLTGQTGLYRIRLSVEGAAPFGVRPVSQ